MVETLVASVALVVGEVQSVVELEVAIGVDVVEVDDIELCFELLDELAVVSAWQQSVASFWFSFQYYVLTVAAVVSKLNRHYILQKISQICIKILLNVLPSVEVSSASRRVHLVFVA